MVKCCGSRAVNTGFVTAAEMRMDAGVAAIDVAMAGKGRSQAGRGVRLANRLSVTTKLEVYYENSDAD